MKSKLVNLFEENVKVYPQRIAVFYDGNALTYQELSERSNQLARHLMKNGVTPGDIVSLLFDRSLDFIVGLWGVLKSGASYLPLDPDLPEQRIVYMLEQSKSNHIVTQGKYANNFSENYTTHIIEKRVILSESKSMIHIQGANTEFAYCIFTSGSTGFPKGVLIRQASVFNLVKGLSEQIYAQYEGKQLRIALTASFSFDASVQQIFAAFLLGHGLYILDDKSRKQGDSMLQFFNQNRIDIADGTPTHLKLFLKSNPNSSNLETLSSWMLAGEVLEKGIVLDFYNNFGTNTQLYNLYGPTETCVDSTCFKVDYNKLNKYDSIPIGKPLKNERVYVVDDSGNILKPGKVGEICIAGEGLAVGYVNNTELTLDLFKENWIETKERVYRTGDLGQLEEDGNLLYMGRIDDEQVKLRGFRIELPEIEIQLKKHPSVSYAFASMKKVLNEKHLVAYYESDKEIEVNELRDFLYTRLPNYMVPSYFQRLMKLPLSVSGKLDRRSLPNVKINFFQKKEEELDDVEVKLTKIWSLVLQVPREKINRKSDFFTLGGNSLKSILIANRIKEEFGVQISLRQFFELQNIENFRNYITNSSTDYQSKRIVPISGVKDLPLTLAQKCFYFLNALKEEQTLSYNIPQIFILNGHVSLTRLNVAFQKLIQRHDILRTTFLKNKEGIQCRVLNSVDFNITILDLNEDIKTTFLNFVKAFNLSEPPLFQAGLIKKSKKKYVLFFDINHIISDEISNNILLNELMQFYQEENLESPKLQYKDYAVWQQGEEYLKITAQDKKYWLGVYAETVPLLDLPIDFIRPMKLKDDAHVCFFNLDTSLSKKVNSLVLKEGTTLFNFLLAIYNVLLSKLTNQKDIVIGTPVSGRTHVELEKVVGLFVNTMALRNQILKQQSFKTFLSILQNNTSKALEHQSFVYKDLIDELEITRDSNRNPLFDAFFTFNEVSVQNHIINDSFLIENYEVPYRTAKFDLTLEAVDKSGEIGLSLIGRKDLFKYKTIERFADYFVRLVEQIVSNPEVEIEQISLLSQIEKQKLFSYNQSENIVEKSVLEIFTEQVKQTPDKSALEYQDIVLSYAELDEQSNQLANYLIAKGIKSGQLIGIYMDRSIEMIISLLGILKAGAAYVPFDPDIPQKRSQFILEDASVKCILTSSIYEKVLKNKAELIIPVNTRQKEISFFSTKPPERKIRPNDLMYVIYTSGSTGRPKGVMVEHRSLVNMSLDQVNRFGVTEDDKVLQFAALTFDASISEILMSLFSGATLVMIDKNIITDKVGFIDFLYKKDISVITLPPAFLKILDKEALTFLRCIITAGETAMVGDARFLSEHLEYHNAYGPTECAVCISSYKVDTNAVRKDQIPIGTPIKNLKVYILDENHKLCLPGVIGELCVSGIGVARGYLNRPILTNKKFIDCPIESSFKMYKTGDYARWNDNGELEFIGRRDDQVKIRGFRVELGEIESILDEHQMVKQVSVQLIDHDKGNKVILAFVVPNEQYDLNTIYTYINGSLPSYMKPSQIILVDRIPLTSHGKINRIALLEKYKPELTPSQPKNQIEKQIQLLWMEELTNVSGSPIGINENFFKVGGDSLIAMQLITRINEYFSTKLTLSDFFRHQTISQIAKQIELDSWLNNQEQLEEAVLRRETIL